MTYLRYSNDIYFILYTRHILLYKLVACYTCVVDKKCNYAYLYTSLGRISMLSFLTNVSLSTSTGGTIANSLHAWALAVLVYRHVTLPASTRWHTALAKQYPFQITCVRNHRPPTDDTAMSGIVLSSGVRGNGARYIHICTCYVRI